MHPGQFVQIGVLFSSDDAIVRAASDKREFGWVKLFEAA
jgi:hypothetical protein